MSNAEFIVSKYVLWYVQDEKWCALRPWELPHWCTQFFINQQLKILMHIWLFFHYFIFSPLWSQSGAHWIQKNQIHGFLGLSISCRTEIRLVSQSRQMSEQGEGHSTPALAALQGGGVMGCLRDPAALSPSQGEPHANALLPIPSCPPAGLFQPCLPPEEGNDALCRLT